jgi:hypothetical protein
MFSMVNIAKNPHFVIRLFIIDPSIPCTTEF